MTRSHARTRAPQRSILRWQDPPPQLNGHVSVGRTPGSPWDDIAKVLRDEPGRWAVIFEGTAPAANSLAVRIRQAICRCFSPAGTYEARLRSIDGVHTVFVRYVGTPQC